MKKGIRYRINTAIFYAWFYVGLACYKVGLRKLGGALGFQLGRWMAWVGGRHA